MLFVALYPCVFNGARAPTNGSTYAAPGLNPYSLFFFFPGPIFFQIFNPSPQLFPKIRKKAQALPTGNACALIFFSCLSTSQDNSTNELLISLILLVYFINDLLTTLCKPSISCCLKTCLVDLTTDVLGSSLLDDLIQSSSYIRVGSRVSKVA